MTFIVKWVGVIKVVSHSSLILARAGAFAPAAAMPSAKTCRTVPPFFADPDCCVETCTGSSTYGRSISILSGGREQANFGRRCGGGPEFRLRSD
ncbi:MAG: hypothetical protein LAP85_20495 [Acidobacteriia bacterium]|nr:hypothetical protein [Terriglobia bacterium]